MLMAGMFVLLWYLAAAWEEVKNPLSEEDNTRQL